MEIENEKREKLEKIINNLYAWLMKYYKKYYKNDYLIRINIVFNSKTVKYIVEIMIEDKNKEIKYIETII
jgi:hypothetical protein